MYLTPSRTDTFADLTPSRTGHLRGPLSFGLISTSIGVAQISPTEVRRYYPEIAQVASFQVTANPKASIYVLAAILRDKADNYGSRLQRSAGGGYIQPDPSNMYYGFGGGQIRTSDFRLPSSQWTTAMRRAFIHVHDQGVGFFDEGSSNNQFIFNPAGSDKGQAGADFGNRSLDFYAKFKRATDWSNL